MASMRETTDTTTTKTTTRDIPDDILKSIKLQELQLHCLETLYNEQKGYLSINENPTNPLYSYYNYKYTGQHLYNLEDIRNTNDVYTFILYQYKDPDTKEFRYDFAARPVYSKLESFSKHSSIFYQIIAKHYGIMELQTHIQNIKDRKIRSSLHYLDIEVIFAGEIMMRGSGIVRYNFLSGTFMEERFIEIAMETGISEDVAKLTLKDYSLPLQHTPLMFEGIMRTTTGFEGRFQYDDSGQSFIQFRSIDEEISKLWGVHSSFTELPQFRLYMDRSVCKKNSRNTISMDLATIFSRIGQGIRGVSPLIKDDDLKRKIKEDNPIERSVQTPQEIEKKFDDVYSLLQEIQADIEKNQSTIQSANIYMGLIEENMKNALTNKTDIITRLNDTSGFLDILQDYKERTLGDVDVPGSKRKRGGVRKNTRKHKNETRRKRRHTKRGYRKERYTKQRNTKHRHHKTKKVMSKK